MSGRVYPLVRIRAGDYLALSNDGETLWRITSYLEDGSLGEYDRATGELVRTIRGTFWSVWRYAGTFPFPDGEVPDDLDEWEGAFGRPKWVESSTSHLTRAAALAEVFPPS